jgi:lipopolysaccharide biosynthesis glycosyltransferase
VLLPEYLSDDVHRILFLDADTLVTGSLNALFELDLDGRSVAGCLDPLSFNADTFERLEYDPSLKYLCAGVLMINLDYWREHGLEERIIAFATDQAERLRFWDQDAVNYVCRDTKLVLPLRYGVMSCFFWPAWVGRIGSKEELRECLLDPAIIHFAGNAPWKKELSRMLFHEDWQRYNKMLRRPVVRRYSLKGFKLLKLFAWNIVFPGKRKDRLITREKALKFIS